MYPWITMATEANEDEENDLITSSGSSTNSTTPETTIPVNRDGIHLQAINNEDVIQTVESTPNQTTQRKVKKVKKNIKPKVKTEESNEVEEEEEEGNK
jgi:hypothetical protein